MTIFELRLWPLYHAKVMRPDVIPHNLFRFVHDRQTIRLTYHNLMHLSDIIPEGETELNLIPIPTLSGDEGTILRLETQLFEAQAKIQEFAIGETRKERKTNWERFLAKNNGQHISMGEFETFSTVYGGIL
ncbi:hypothetical protein B0H13DRAFT_1861390 [Mycena leptocephala]|nr:hypothetical protein B0H13DRAFT_1861390 [Mycena leptocephala]